MPSMPWTHGFWLTRALVQRGLGLVYLIAFVAALLQFKPLLGEHGLLPAPEFMRWVPFARSPSLFYLAPKDWAFTGAAWVGIALSLLVLTGVADGGSVWLSAGVWFGLWALYISFVNVGQIFYGFGWESLLCEAGFYAIFLGPRTMAPPTAVMWLYRWLLFRVMFGAGLIKLRGDPCWRSLTCLDYHYQTQPMPNPLSRLFYFAPQWTRHGGVLFNHFAELVAPLFYFAPSALCAAAGGVTIVFQGLIMLSGNLSWLNLLTMVIAIPCFDDAALQALFGLKAPPTVAALSAGFVYVVWALTAGVIWLSRWPALNMLSAGQIMNTSYNPLHLVGTYGAFGTVTRERDEIVLEGTDESVLLPTTRWREYEFKGKPGDLSRLPAQVAPYHLRLDWLMWFAAMYPSYAAYGEPWFPRLVDKLLQNDRPTLALLANDPFPSAPPRFIRARLYRYRFAAPAERRETGRCWDRKLVGEYLPPVSRSEGGLRVLHELEAP